MQLDPNSLPNIETLRRRSEALAMLDAIISPEWESRYYSFNAGWAEGEAMGSMRNGCGDDWFILFGSFGAAIKGLAHETSIAGDKVFADEVQRQVPQTFSSFLTEAAFGMDWLSYCYWRRTEDLGWQKVVHPDPAMSRLVDGSSEYLALLVEPAASYQEFANDYYEIELSLAAVESVYRHAPLTEGLVTSLNPQISLSAVRDAATEIGYPFRLKDAQS